MSNTLAMNINDSSQDLFQDSCCIFFAISAAHPYLLDDIITLEAFTYNKVIVFILVHLQISDNVRVVKRSEELHLLDEDLCAWVLTLGLLNDGAFNTCFLVDTDTGLAVVGITVHVSNFINVCDLFTLPEKHALASNL